MSENTRCGACEHYWSGIQAKTGKCEKHGKWVRASTSGRKCFVQNRFPYISATGIHESPLGAMSEPDPEKEAGT